MSNDTPRTAAQQRDYERQLREMNKAPLTSAVRDQELREQAEAAEAALRRRERELADFFDNASIGLHWVGPDGVIQRVNQAELDMLGYEREEYLGHHIAEFHVDEPVIEDILARLTRGETLREYPARLRRKDGSIRDGLINSSVLFDENGEFIHTRCVTTDVTERKRAEIASARLAVIVTSSEDAIISKDLDGVITSWNRGAERLFGYAAEEAVGKPVTILIPSDHLDEEPGILARIRRGESVEHYETVRRRKDGTLLDISLTVSPIKDSQGTVIGASKVARDITEQKQIEQALRESEAKYRTLFDSIDEGFCIIEFVDGPHGPLSDYVHVEANPAYERHAGIPNVVGQKVREMVPDEADGWVELYRNVLVTGEPIRFERELAATRRHLELSAFRVEPESRRQVAVLFQDVTARKQAERRIQEQTGELAAAGRRKDEFLAMLSHELRNPMAPMLNALQLMGQEGGENEFQREARGVIERQVRHLSRLTDDLLEVSRITTGRIGLHLERMDLNGIVQRAVERLTPSIDRRRQELSVTLAEGVVWLEADGDRLEQVVGNLLNNASKYNKPGGHIRLTVEAGDRGRGTGNRSQEAGDREQESEGRRQVTGDGSAGSGDGEAASSLTPDSCPLTPDMTPAPCLLTSDMAIVRVRDDGIGMTAELLPNIFDLFSQADNSLNHTEGGLGIGLALVKSLVELHRGTVEARSAGIGRGSEFIVRLPLASGVRQPAEDAASSAFSEETQSLRILVVDDNVDAARMCAMPLRSWGHEVRTAHDGPAALKRARGFHPQVILCDIGLPDMNGHEVARHVRQNPHLQGVLLVAVSGYGQDTDRRRSKEAGFDQHMVKPVESSELKELLAGIDRPSSGK